MIGQFNTGVMLMLVMMAGGVAGIEAQEIGGIGTSPVVPWVDAVDLAQAWVKTDSGQDARTTLPARKGGAVVPRKVPQPQPVPSPVSLGNAKPAMFAIASLAGFGSLSAGRQKLIETALALAMNSPWLPYVFGGADPALGGLDCSGAMYYVMTQCGLDPPRSSVGQYLWLRDHQQLHVVPNAATATDDPSLAELRPGDLLFWATAQQADDAKAP